MFGAKPKPAEPGFWSRIGNQGRAALEGAVDSATFGLDDQASAGIHAAADWLRGKQFYQAYKKRIAEEHAHDAYDASHYGVARTVGTLGSLFIPGGGTGAIAKLLGKTPQIARLGGRAIRVLEKMGAPAEKIAPRIAQVTRLGGRERVAIGATGAVGGVAGQAGSDVLQGHLSSARDYVGAAAGGTAEALASLRGNPKMAAALGGATASFAQDALNGRPLSVGNAAKAAYASSLLSGAASKIATRKAAQATIKQKEKMGEWGSRLRTLANLDVTISSLKRREPLHAMEGYSAGYTYPDLRTALNKLIESKFGETARLTYRQTQAFKQLGSTYRVDHFLPRDVGSAAGFLLSQPAHNAGHQRFDGLTPSAHPLAPTQDRARFAHGLPSYFG